MSKVSCASNIVNKYGRRIQRRGSALGLLSEATQELHASEELNWEDLIQLYDSNVEVKKILQAYKLQELGEAKKVKSKKIFVKPITEYKNDSVHLLTSPNVSNLFHTLHIAKSYFINRVNEDLTRAVFIGSKRSKYYVRGNDEININIQELKNDLFERIVSFLVAERVLKKEDFYKDNVFIGQLYKNESFDTTMYSNYENILGKLFNHLTSISGKIKYDENKRFIPRLDGDIQKPIDRIKFDVYNAAVFLSNFDNVVIKEFGNILNVNFQTFNTFLSPHKGLKYSIKTTGDKEEYFKDEEHQSEAAEQLRDDFTEKILNTIPRLNKKGESTHEYLSMVDFYGLSATFREFQLVNLKELSKDPNWVLLSKDSRKALQYYFEKILDADKDNYAEEKLIYQPFMGVIDIIYSLKSFLDSVSEKESNDPKISLYDIVSQPLNNSNGAVYAIYNPLNGTVFYKELYSHNVSRIQAQNRIYTKLQHNSDRRHLYNEDDVNKLNTDSEFSAYMNNRFKIFIPEENIIDLKRMLYKRLPSDTDIDEAMTQALRNKLIFIIKVINGSAIEDKSGEGERTTIFDLIEDRERIISSGPINDSNTEASAIKPLIDEVQDLIDVSLQSYRLRPVTTITTASGAKIPTFKLANLAYSDAEVLLNRMKFEENKSNRTSYRTLFLQAEDLGNFERGQSRVKSEALLLGTTTKLEIVNDNESREASKWLPIENFTSNFLYDYLGLMKQDSSWYNVMIGNYSDKNTILAKQIATKVLLKGQFVIGGTNNVMSMNNVRNLVFTQQQSYFSDLYRDLIAKYNNLFGLNLNNKLSDYVKSFKIINEKLSKFKDKDSFLNVIKGLNLVEEQDYSVYEGKIRLNQNLYDNFSIYSNKNNFDNFISFELNNLVFDLTNFKSGEFGRYLLNNDQLFSLLGEDYNLDKLLNFFKIDNLDDYFVKNFIEESKQVEEDENDPEITSFKMVPNLLIKGLNGQVNPLLERWLLTNMLFRNEYLNITVKHEYMHSAKGLPIREDSQIGNLEMYSKESSARYSGMAKRNVAFTSTYEVPIQGSRTGVPEKVKIAVIADPETGTYNIGGDQEKVKFQDGASFINAIYSRMIAASYPGKDYNDTLKRFGVMITPYGSAVKKDAEFVITNQTMLNSILSPIDHFTLNKRMLSAIPINIDEFELGTSYNHFFVENGKYYKLISMNINNNKLTRKLQEYDKENNSIGSAYEDEIKEINTLFDIWQSLGGQYSVEWNDDSFISSEDSNKVMYDIVTNYKDEKGKYSLKDKMIHIVSTSGSFKSGAINLNPSSYWYGKNDKNYNENDSLGFFEFESVHMGPQLDAGHNADASKIKEITQVISSLAQNERTAHIANEVYQDIARLISQSAAPWIKSVISLSEKDLSNLYISLSKEFARHLANSPTVDLATSIAESFGKEELLPFSNRNFFQRFVRDLIVKLNTEFITRYYNGIGAVLNPSHHMYRVFEVPIYKEGKWENVIYSQEDMMKEALNNYVPGEVKLSNEEILKSYIEQKLPIQDVTIDKINLTDTVIHPETGELWEISNPTEYYKLKEYGLAKQIKKINSVPRDLKPSEITFQVAFMVDKLEEKARKAKLFTQISLQGISPKVRYASYQELEEIGKINNIQGVVDSFYDPRTDEIVLNEGYKDTEDENSIIIHEIVGHKGLSALFNGVDLQEYKNILLSTKDFLFANASKLLERSNIKTVNEAADLYGFDLNTEQGQISLIEELLSRQAEEPVVLNWFQKTIGRLQLLLAKVFGLERPMGREGVIELLLMANKALITGKNFNTQMKDDERFFPILNNKTLFDLDPVRLRYKLDQHRLFLNKKIPDPIDEQDLNILTQFATKFKLFTFNGDFDYQKMNIYLKSWTQRILELLDEGYIMNDLISDKFIKNGIINFDAYFGKEEFGDSLIADIYDDVKDHYMKNNSVKIYNQKINAAELVLPNIYKSNFNNGFDSISYIKNKGETYFKDILEMDYAEDENPYDVKLITSTDQTIYVKFVHQLPAELENPNILQEDERDGKVVQYRLDEQGDYLYVKPPNSSVLIRNGIDVVYIRITEEEDATTLKRGINRDFSKFIESVKNIRSIVPIMNNTIFDIKDSDGVIVNFRENILSYYYNLVKIRFSSNEKVDKDWYNNHREDIINKLSKKQYASWEKSHEFVAARIPAQSMQSFMSMKNIAYLNTTTNNAYVSVWQIWLQGSDFDIDKAYIMGYGFNKGSQYDIWSNMFDYDTKEQLDAIESLPIPSGKHLEFVRDNANDFIKKYALDLSDDITWFEDISRGLINNFDIAKRMSSEDIIRFSKLLRKISRQVELIENMVNSSDIENKEDYLKQVIKNVDEFESLLTFINFYNEYKGYLHSKYTLQNSIVSKIKSIINSPSNQVLATTAISIRTWHNGADEAALVRLKQINNVLKDWLKSNDEGKPSIDKIVSTLADVNIYSLTSQEVDLLNEVINKKSSADKKVEVIGNIIKNLIERKDKFSAGNSVGMFKQQYQASVGKQDVGIGANGLKVFFALSNYYNDWYRKLDDGIIRFDGISDNKLFLKEFFIKDSNTGELKTHIRTTIADTRISRSTFKSVLGLYGYESLETELREINKIQAALAISGFISGATDNAKELVMAKINAVVDLAAMHLYMLALGFSAKDISVYMNSDLGKYISNNIQNNLFETTKPNYVSSLIRSYKEIPEKLSLYNNGEELDKITKTFEDIYNGGQEFSSLSSIFRVNGSINANMEELNNFLNVLERSMFAAENSTFGFTLKSLKKITPNSLTDEGDYEMVSTAVKDEIISAREIKEVLFTNENGEEVLRKLSPENLSFKTIIIKILYRNDHLKKLFETESDKVINYIVDVLRKSSSIEVSFINYYNQEETHEVSLLSGGFDSRYYIHPKNKKYVKAAAEYYNLIKSTINIFDVLESTPHFREMTHSVGTMFNVALLSSKKFNAVFSLFRSYLKEYKEELMTGNKKNQKIKPMLGNDAFPMEMTKDMTDRMMATFDNYMISSWLKSSFKRPQGLDIANFKFYVKNILKKAGINDIVLLTSNDAKVYSKQDLKSAKKSDIAVISTFTRKISVDGDEDFTLDLTTDYGIANFKYLMETVFFNILEKSDATNLDSTLSLRKIRNVLGLYGTQIVPTYGISTLNNPISIENFLKLINEFNSVDSKISNEHKLVNTKGQTVKWQDLLYIYNLIVNYERYGDNRLTPLFQDYVKDKGMIANSYLRYCVLVDRGQVDIFETDAQDKNALKQQINNVLYLTLHKNGFLKMDKESLQIKHNDFSINTVLPIISNKDGVNYQIVSTIRALLQNKNLIINYKCI